MRTEKRKQQKQFKPVLKSFNCPNCGAALKITAVGVTVTVACYSCGSTIDANDPNYKIIKKSREAKAIGRPSIPIGSRGKISGNTYECIGFMVRHDGPYEWREYLLYNPYIGFRWLFEMNGHWSFIKRIRDKADANRKSQQYKGHVFDLFNIGSGKVRYVEGEFYWRVKVGDSSKIVDYISPPFMLSRESTTDEITWTQATYVTPDRIKKAFNLKHELPTQIGVGPNQPSPVKENFRKNLKLALTSIMACIMMFALRAMIADNGAVLSGRYDYVPSKLVSTNNGGDKKIAKDDLYKSDPFIIASDGKNIEFIVDTNLYNNWVYLDALLVNAETGKGIPLPLEVSYYRGSDWSEGNKKNSVRAYNIPAGEYYLSTKHQSNVRKRANININYRLKSDVPILSNLIIVIIVLLIFPILGFVQARGFEARRWSNSSENPYDTEDY